jgi:hypothetical protein
MTNEGEWVDPSEAFHPLMPLCFLTVTTQGG